MSTKMLLHGDDIRMTMMLMNMIMATAKTQPFSQCTPIYIAVLVQPRAPSSWADAAAACLLRLMQPLRRPWCMRYI